MTARRDDMVMAPRFRRESRPRERAREERRTQIHHQKKRRLARRLRKSQAVLHAKQKRRVAGRKKPSGYAGATRASRMLAAKSASRAVPVAGWILLLMDLIILGGQAARRFGSDKSGRLIEAEDAIDIFGDLDERAIANASVLAGIENDPDALRATGQDGKMASSLRSNVVQLKKRALERAQGADMISRDPHFDSADTLLDQLIRIWNSAELQEKLDKLITAVRKLYGGSVLLY